jgi:hypothetical protein
VACKGRKAGIPVRPAKDGRRSPAVPAAFVSGAQIAISVLSRTGIYIQRGSDIPSGESREDGDESRQVRPEWQLLMSLKTLESFNSCVEEIEALCRQDVNSHGSN